MRLFKIIDYGTGNIGSIVAVFESLGYYAGLARQPGDLESADLAILPGVGAAGAAMASLQSSGLANALIKRRSAQRPIMGICLGAQLFGSYLHEGQVPGFGWIAGEVAPLPDYPFYNNGWCRLDYDQLTAAGLARGLRPLNTFFFNHRYVLARDDRLVRVDARDVPGIPAIYLDQALCGVQFHPEKSQAGGRTILRNILEDYYGF